MVASPNVMFPKKKERQKKCLNLSDLLLNRKDVLELRRKFGT